jgi:hypothetical protein
MIPSKFDIDFLHSLGYTNPNIVKYHHNGLDIFEQDNNIFLKQDNKQNNSILVNTKLQSIILKTIEHQKLKQNNKEDNFKKLDSKIS